MAVSYFRARILGGFTSGEQWSINPTFAPLVTPTPPSQAAMQAWATQIRDGVQPPSTVLALLSSSGFLSRIRTEYYAADGTLARAAESSYDTVLPGTGTATTPSQLAVVASLLTGIPGRRYRGRL